MLKMQVIDIELVTGILDAKNRLHRVGGVGVGGFFGEETGKMGRKTGTKGLGTKGLGIETARVGDWTVVIFGPPVCDYFYCGRGNELICKRRAKYC
jgi:hypothetical protein